MEGDSSVKMETPEGDIQSRIIELCQQFPQGIGDKVLQSSMNDVDPRERALGINKLLVDGKLDLFKSEGGLLYRLKTPSKASAIRGDQEEKVVFKIIEGAGNIGMWLRDIRLKSNLVQTQLTKVLKSLETKKLIKAVKCVNATKKRVYMLYNLEPDRSVTGGAWYSDQDFESEFVEILNQQCHRFLYHKLEKSRECQEGPIAAKHMSMSSSDEVLRFISDLGISKVQLRNEDIESILDTIIFDGKAEKSEGMDGAKLYRAIESLVPSAGLVRSPCGVCPVMKYCGDVGSVTPATCQYFKDWLQI